MVQAVAALGVPKTLRVELAVAAPGRRPGLTGSGLLLVNPPWVLEAELREALPWLAQRLGDTDPAWRLDWLVG